MRTDIFVIRLGPLYLTESGSIPWTSNPNNLDIKTFTLDVAKIAVGGKETIAIHPSANPTFTVKCENEGHMYLSDFSTEDMGAAISKALLTAMDYPHTDVTIRVNGDVAYLNQSGFSHEPECWVVEPSGWLAFEAKGTYTSENGELFVNTNRQGKRFIRGSWTSTKSGEHQHETRTFNYNPNSFKKAMEWLNKLEGSSDE